MGIKNKSEKIYHLFLLQIKYMALVIYVDYKFSTTTYDSYAWQLAVFGEQFVHIPYQCMKFVKQMDSLCCCNFNTPVALICQRHALHKHPDCLCHQGNQ